MPTYSTNNPSWTSSGKFSYALSFDGIDDYVEVPDSPDLDMTSGITIAAWVKSNKNSHSDILQSVVSKDLPLTTFNTFEAYDASTTDSLDTEGFRGVAFDGRYAYFVPNYKSDGRHGNVLRYDTQGDFKTAASWDAYDASSTDGLTTKGYIGGVFDGRYLYFVPYNNGANQRSEERNVGKECV